MIMAINGKLLIAIMAIIMARMAILMAILMAINGNDTGQYWP